MLLLMFSPLLSGFQRVMSLPLLQYGYRCIHHLGRVTFRDIQGGARYSQVPHGAPFKWKPSGWKERLLQMSGFINQQNFERLTIVFMISALVQTTARSPQKGKPLVSTTSQRFY